MSPTNCVVCGAPILVGETPMEDNDPASTKYWTYEEDGSRRPYCGVECGLNEYEEKKNVE